MHVDMDALVVQATAYFASFPVEEAKMRHKQCCDLMADRFGLWRYNDMWPVWLSRVVEGVLADVVSGENLDNDIPLLGPECRGNPFAGLD